MHKNIENNENVEGNLSSENVQSMFIKVLDDIVDRVDEIDYSKFDKSILNGNSSPNFKENKSFLEDKNSEYTTQFKKSSNVSLKFEKNKPNYNDLSLENLNINGKILNNSLPNINDNLINKSNCSKNEKTNLFFGSSNENFKKHRALSDYGNNIRLYQKTHLQSKEILYDNYQLTTNPNLYPENKVIHNYFNSSHKRYKFNRTKHQFQPPFQYQRTLSCSVAVLNSSSYQSKKSKNNSAVYKSLSSNSIKKAKLDRKKILTLICLASLAFASQCSMSIIAPFFPLESSKKGVTEFVSGLIFSIHAFTVMVFSPLFGLITPKLGAKKVLLTGIIGSSFAIVAFGSLDHIKGKNLFISLCFIVRICEALGSCAFSTVSYIYIMKMFPNEVGWAFGLLETFSGLGMSIGPFIGGTLYSFGGYSLPFYILGILSFCIVPLSLYALEEISYDSSNETNINNESISEIKKFNTNSSSFEDDFSSYTSSTESINSDQEPLTYWSLIKIPSVIIISLVIIIVSQSQGFLDPTIEPHLRNFGIQPWLVGFVFLAMSTTYAICSPLVGRWASKTKNKFIIMLLGLIITFLGLSIVGPSPIISDNPSVYYSLCGMIIIGAGFAVAFIPTFEALLLVVIKFENYDDNIATYSLVSGFWSSMFALGEVIGPTVGGILSEYLDFPDSSSTMAVICFGSIIVLVFAVFYIEMKNDDYSSIDYSESGDTLFSDDSIFEEKKIIKAKNYQKSLHSSNGEFFDESSYLLEN